MNQNLTTSTEQEHLHFSSATSNPPSSPVKAMTERGETSPILLNNSSKSGNSTSTPSVLEGVVLAIALCSVNMGRENAETVAGVMLSKTVKAMDVFIMVMIGVL